MKVFDDFFSAFQQAYSPEETIILQGSEPVSASAFFAAVEKFEVGLKSARIGPGALVCVADSQNWNWLAAMLAIFHSRCVFLPSIEQSLFHGNAVAFAPNAIIDDSGTILPAGNSRISERLFNCDAGYVVPTSGSTGEPKWIAGNLAGVLEFVFWEKEMLTATKKDCVSLLHRPIFDPFYRDVFLPFACGGRLVIPPRHDLPLWPRECAEWLKQSGISVMHVIPTLVRHLGIEWDDGVTLGSMRAVLIAGEPLFFGDIARWSQQFAPNARLFNLYGPSETTLAKFCYEIINYDMPRGAAVPVGKTICGATAIVLSEESAPCAVDQAGEVYIRYSESSFGYFDQGGTQPCFITNPFDAHDSTAVYRTGDIGYVNTDGDLVLVGRRDDVVKIRGQRIQTAAIEDIIRGHKEVFDVAIKPYYRTDGILALACYVVHTDPLETIMRELRLSIDHLAWPQHWMTVKVLPTTASGKLNRKALPDPPQWLPSVAVTEISGTLREVIAIWHDVLKPDRPITPSDSFFHLGGQSIEAVRIVTRINATLDPALTLRRFFQLETPGNLVTEIDQKPSIDRPTMPFHSLLPRSNVDQWQPLTGAQLRFWNWIKRANTYSSQFQFSCCFHLCGVDFARLVASMQAAIGPEPAFRVEFVETGGHARQRLAHGTFAPDVIDLTSISECERYHVACCKFKEFASRRFLSGKELLVRTLICKMGPQSVIVAIANHILASDGYTKTILLRRISDEYASRLRTNTDKVDFFDFALWESKWRACWPGYIGFWREVLTDAKPPELPFLLRSGTPGRDTVSVRSVLEENTVESLSNEARSHQVTFASAVLWAFLRALGPYQKGRSFLIVSHARRPIPEVHEMIGCFTDSLYYPFSRVTASWHGVRDVHRDFLACIENAVPSFEYVHAEVLSQYDMTSPWECPIIFAPQPQFADALVLPGVKVEDLAWEPPKWIWPLEVYPQIAEGQCTLVINFSVDLFSRAFVTELLDCQRCELESLVPKPSEPNSPDGFVA
jgi:acyl carrier protein